MTWFHEVNQQHDSVIAVVNIHDPATDMAAAASAALNEELTVFKAEVDEKTGIRKFLFGQGFDWSKLPVKALVLVFGKTGSGKTVLMNNILKATNPDYAVGFGRTPDAQAGLAQVLPDSFVHGDLDSLETIVRGHEKRQAAVEQKRKIEIALHNQKTGEHVVYDKDDPANLHLMDTFIDDFATTKTSLMTPLFEEMSTQGRHLGRLYISGQNPLFLPTYLRGCFTHIAITKVRDTKKAIQLREQVVPMFKDNREWLDKLHKCTRGFRVMVIDTVATLSTEELEKDEDGRLEIERQVSIFQADPSFTIQKLKYTKCMCRTPWDTVQCPECKKSYFKYQKVKTCSCRKSRKNGRRLKRKFQPNIPHFCKPNSACFKSHPNLKFKPESNCAKCGKCRKTNMVGCDVYHRTHDKRYIDKEAAAIASLMKTIEDERTVAPAGSESKVSV